MGNLGMVATAGFTFPDDMGFLFYSILGIILLGVLLWTTKTKSKTSIIVGCLLALCGLLLYALVHAPDVTSDARVVLSLMAAVFVSLGGCAILLAINRKK